MSRRVRYGVDGWPYVVRLSSAAALLTPLGSFGLPGGGPPSAVRGSRPVRPPRSPPRSACATPRDPVHGRRLRQDGFEQLPAAEGAPR